MPAGRTYTPIASNTLTAAATDITFTSISGSYTDILVIGRVRSSRTAGLGALGIRVNNDSSSIYSSTRIYSNGSSTPGSDRFSGTYFEIGEIASASGNSNIFTPISVHFNNYINTAIYKTVLGTTRNSENSTGVQQMAGLYSSTSAITQLKLYDAYGGNLEVGTTVTLYGILAA